MKKVVKKVKIEEDDEPKLVKKDVKAAANLKKAKAIVSSSDIDDEDDPISKILSKKATSKKLSKPECSNSPFVKIADIES